MASTESGPGRRSFLQWAAGLVGGLTAVAACDQGAGASASAAAGSMPAPPAAGGSRTLLGRGRMLAPAPTAAGLDAGGVAFAGEILDPASGLAAGRFRSQALGAPGGLTVHTLELPEGTLFALGAGGGRSGTSAVVGGTGGFAGARGTLSLRETAGNGVRAELEITLSLT